MMQRFKNSWLLLEHTVEILGSNLKLLLFPILTLIATSCIFLFFLGTFILQPTGHAYTEKAHWTGVLSSVFTKDSIDQVSQPMKPGERRELQLNKVGLVIAAGIYFLAMFLATFFNVAFYHEILEALHGRPVGIIQGISFAFSKLKPILFWSLLAGLIGYLIKQLESRFGLMGKIIIRVIGLTWSVASVFAIPLIVTEEETSSNPIQILKSSAQLLKKTWGETLIGFTGINIIVLFALLSSLMAVVGIFILSVSLHSPMIIAITWVTWIFFIFGFIYFTNVATNIFHCALFVFASTGEIPTGYSKEMMDLPWKRKPS